MEDRSDRARMGMRRQRGIKRRLRQLRRGDVAGKTTDELWLELK